MNRELIEEGVKFEVMREVLTNNNISSQLPINMWSKKVSVPTLERMIHLFTCVFNRYTLNFKA